MNDKDQKQFGKTLWGTADPLRGAMNAEDFRDYLKSARHDQRPVGFSAIGSNVRFGRRFLKLCDLFSRLPA